MKTLILLLALQVYALSAIAQTWTIHGAKDNYLYIQSDGPSLEFGDNFWALQWFEHGQWDWAFDQDFPDYSDSGISTFVFDGSDQYSQSSWSGYSNVLIFDIPELMTGPISLIRATLTGPYPDYYGDWSEYILPSYGGEYWIDFSEVGIVRISTSQPNDFGKWAWDGSINPNYVEPISPLKSNRGKHLGKQQSK